MYQDYGIANWSSMDKTTLRNWLIDLLHKEVGDLLCMIELCIEKRLLNEDELTVHIKQKREKLKKWSNLDHE